MQLSHDDNVVFTSSKGFWRANSIGASSEGMATPQERYGFVKFEEAVRLSLCRCRPADIYRQVVVMCGTGLDINAAISRYIAAEEHEHITIVGKGCATCRCKASGVRRRKDKRRATAS